MHLTCTLCARPTSRALCNVIAVKVWSNHKNLVQVATRSQSQRVMRWRLILEEFSPDIKHISGEENVVADAISRLPTANNDQKEQSTEAQGLAEIAMGGEHVALEDEYTCIHVL